MQENGKNYEIVVREDGIYLTIENKEGGARASRQEITDAVDGYGIKDVDYIALSEAIKSTDAKVEVKLSSSTTIYQVPESAAIEVSDDRLQAHITFSEPVNNGKMMTTEDVILLLGENKIVPDSKLIHVALANKRYGRKILIAQGDEPVNGTDGFLQFHFDRSNIKPKPKIMEDGTVNFKQLDMFRLCNRGDVLVTSVPAKDGRDGKDVYGNIVAAPKPRPAAVIPRGKGTALSPDGLHLLADVSGQLLLLEGKINISPHLEIAGNVDNSTGNVDFNGQVTIRGNVVSGFTVKAAGNIEVYGVCEAATLISANGNIVLGNGIQGADKGVLEAAADITAKFIESCKVTAGGNITADSIRKSHVKCDGSVVVAGKNGLLVGGSIIAGEKLIATTVGSPMGTLTDIEVGGSPKDLNKQKELTTEFSRQKIEYEKCDKAVETLNALRKKDQLTPDKKALLVKMVNMKMVLRDKMTKLQNEIDEITRNLAVNVGTVSVKNVIRPGVRITIGNAQMTIRDELSNCRLRNNGEKISIGPNL
ncbi:MAG: FapA family protein [Defluviitaleaceae bacterium]|nr:FapA family protein [Defluviitaleaceae bacterium]MCL2263713.1 FapA family protein [Defluviitaleaceae bacterium]